MAWPVRCSHLCGFHTKSDRHAPLSPDYTIFGMNSLRNALYRNEMLFRYHVNKYREIHVRRDGMNSFQNESYWYRVKRHPFNSLKSKHKVEPSSPVVCTQISGEYQQLYLEFQRPNPHFKTGPMASNFLFVSCLLDDQYLWYRSKLKSG